MRRLKGAEEKASEYGVADDYGGQADVREQEGDGPLAAADDRLTSTSTPFQTSLVRRHHRRFPVDIPGYTRLPYLHVGETKQHNPTDNCRSNER